MLVVAGGVTAIRADSLEQFVRFLGVRSDEPPQGVETYSQRTCWRTSASGSGKTTRSWAWAGSDRRGKTSSSRISRTRTRRFPDVVELAFPAAGREWGVQNLYVQMLADAGIVGLLLLLAVGGGGLVLAWRTVTAHRTPGRRERASSFCGALLTLAGESASLGIVAGIPLQAATCLLLGLAAAGAATVEEQAGV